MALEEIGVKLIAAGEQAFLNAMNKADKSVHGFGKSTESAEKPTKTLSERAIALSTVMGNALYNGAMAAGKAIMGFATDSITAASDLAETTNKVTVVFGEQSDAVLAWGKNAALTMGMSQNAALSAAGTYGNLFTSMGMTSQASADMSMSLVKTAADLASFNNMSPEEVLEKLRAGLTGETEPLKSLGVNLNQAAIEAEAMSLGLSKGTVDQLAAAEASVALEKAVKATSLATRKYGADSIQAREAAIKEAKAQEKLEEVMAGGNVELTAAAKAQATYSLIMKQTTNALDDFSETSSGLANQQRILKAQMEDTKAALGKAFLPVVNLVMNAMTKLFSSPEFQKGMADFTAGIEKAAKWVEDNWPIISKVFERVWKNIQKVLEKAKAIIKVGLDFVTKLWKKNGNDVESTLKYMWKTVSDIFNTIMNVITGILNKLMPFIKKFLDSVMKFWEENGDEIMANVKVVWDVLAKLIQAAAKLIGAIVEKLVELVGKYWEENGDKIMTTVKIVWDVVTTVIRIAAGIITGIIEVLTMAIQGDWYDLGEYLKYIWDVAWAAIKLAAINAWTGITNWLSTAVADIKKFFTETNWSEVGTNLVNGIWKGISDGWGWLVNQISGLAQDLLDLVKRILNIGSPSKEFQKIGLDIMLGWGKGILDNSGIPLRAIAATAQTMAPLAASVAAPSVYNYSNSVSYNLNMTTTQSSDSVQRSFAMMRMLAPRR